MVGTCLTPIGCSDPTSSQPLERFPPASTEGAVLSAEDHAVLSVALTDAIETWGIPSKRGARTLVLNVDTLDPSAPEEMFFHRAGDAVVDALVKRMPAMPRSCVEALVAQRAPRTLDASLIHTPVPLETVRYSEYLEGTGFDWDRFYETHPESGGVVGVSRVGFNDARDAAAVYVTHHPYGMGSVGSIVRLSRGANGWVAEELKDMWIQ